MPRGINDVDTVIIPFDSGVFREDGNPTLFLQIVGDVYKRQDMGTGIMLDSRRKIGPKGKFRPFILYASFPVTLLAIANFCLLYTSWW